MCNFHYGGAEYQYDTSTIEYSLLSDVYVWHFKHWNKYPQMLDRGSVDARAFNSGDVESLFYMILYWYYDSNIYTYKILNLLAEWYVEYFIYLSSTIYMGLYYTLKYQINDTDNTIYM